VTRDSVFLVRAQVPGTGSSSWAVGEDGSSPKFIGVTIATIGYYFSQLHSKVHQNPDLALAGTGP
jgi:hypothetical protein